MNTKNFVSRIFIATLAIFSYACQQEEQVEPTNTETVSSKEMGSKSYIITYKSDKAKIKFTSKKFEDRTKAVYDYTKSFLNKHDINAENITYTYGSALEGFAATLSEKEVAVLKNDPRVATIEEDQIITLDFQVNEKSKNNKAQSIPWGISRVGYASGAGKTVWVIDTGVDLDHPDLNVDQSRSRSFVGGSANDGNGHGTHVSGTIAALNNNDGVVGVAYGATIVGVKVLGDGGTGPNSGVVAGIDYVAANARPGDVANLSLGGRANSATDNAIRRLADRNVLVAVAAGNDRANARNYSPARVSHRNVVTVSAMDRNDNFANYFPNSFQGSNYGAVVDYAAPGSSIISTWANGGYATSSGTSMASPHVAGLLLLRGSTNLRTDGRINGDRDRNSDPIAVR